MADYRHFPGGEQNENFSCSHREPTIIVMILIKAIVRLKILSSGLLFLAITLLFD
jgi:hypothetical protein